jgi:hypothetical protein
MAIAVGYALGPLAARVLVAFAPMWVAFAAAGGLALAALVLVVLRLDRDAATAPEDAEPRHEPLAGC